MRFGFDCLIKVRILVRLELVRIHGGNHLVDEKSITKPQCTKTLQMRYAVWRKCVYTRVTC